jgi:non-ribosomal peptide synthetase component E (peptide arylation enzyme)
MNDETTRYTEREAMLERAKGYVTKDRNKSYGEPDEDFQRIAATLNGLGFQVGDGATARKLQGHDVSVIMIALKLSRLMWSPEHRDSWDDIAGYAACGIETALLQKAREDSTQLKLDDHIWNNSVEAEKALAEKIRREEAEDRHERMRQAGVL